MNNNYELATRLNKPVYSDTETSIIPVDNNQVILVPPAGAIFDSIVSLKETKNAYRFGPFDLYAPEAPKSFAQLYNYLTDDENLLNANDNLEDSPEQLEYEVDKNLVQDLLDSTGETFPFEELMAGLTQVLEAFPSVSQQNGEFRDTTPDDIILVLENLTRNKVRIEEALQNLIGMTSGDMNDLILAKANRKFEVYTQIVEFDDA